MKNREQFDPKEVRVHLPPTSSTPREGFFYGLAIAQMVQTRPSRLQDERQKELDSKTAEQVVYKAQHRKIA